MQLTASKPDVYAWSVCRHASMLRGMRSGSRQLILSLVRCSRQTIETNSTPSLESSARSAHLE